MTSPIVETAAVADLFSCDTPGCGAELRATDTRCPKCGRDYDGPEGCALCSDGTCAGCREDRAWAHPRAAKAVDPDRPDEHEVPELLREHALIGAEAIGAASKVAFAYEWQDIARRGNVIALAGLPGAGKSTTQAILATARRNRTGQAIEILGRPLMPAPPDKWIVLIENEMSGSSTSRSLEAAREMLSLDVSTFERVMVLGLKDVRLNSPLWRSVAEMIARGQVDSLFIDSLATFGAPGTHANDEEQAETFMAIRAASKDLPDDEKPLCFLIMHTTKAGTGNDIREIAGSVQRAAQIDVGIIFTAERNDDGKVESVSAVFLKLRESPDDWPKRCTFRTEKVDGLWTLSWDGTVAEKPSGKPLHERVFDAVLLEPLLKSEIAKRLGVSNERVNEAIKILDSAGRIRFTKTAVRGKKAWLIGPKDPNAHDKATGLLRMANEAPGETNGGDLDPPY